MRTKAAALLLALCALAARAEPPPTDPWTDPAWQDLMNGLPRAVVARVHTTQQLLDTRGGGGVVGSREARFEFDGPGGAVSRAVIGVERRGEGGSRRSFTYVYDAGRLVRIDEDGQPTPAWTRRYDAGGRPLEQTERTGAVTARTTWRHDAAGRLLERAFDSGSGARSKEVRRYRTDGTLELVQRDGGALSGQRVEFDAQERPVRIVVTDITSRSETTIVYPAPTEAEHTTHATSLQREGLRRTTSRTSFRVRTPQELRGVEVPELPTMRRDVRDAHREESQTDYDASGRVLEERRLDGAGRVVCAGRLTYHPSGPPRSLRNERLQPDAPCEGFDFDNEVVADARGHWVEQRMWMLRPGGVRLPMAVLTRRIEYRP